MYPSDLTDAEWQLIESFFQRPDPRGNPGKYAKRDIVNAILLSGPRRYSVADVALR